MAGFYEGGAAPLAYQKRASLEGVESSFELRPSIGRTGRIAA